MAFLLIRQLIQNVETMKRAADNMFVPPPAKMSSFSDTNPPQDRPHLQHNRFPPKRVDEDVDFGHNPFPPHVLSDRLLRDEL